MTDGFGSPEFGGGNHASRFDPNYTSDVKRMDGLESTKTLMNDDDRQMSFGQAFSADNLVRAMTSSTLKPSAMQA